MVITAEAFFVIDVVDDFFEQVIFDLSSRSSAVGCQDVFYPRDKFGECFLLFFGGEEALLQGVFSINGVLQTLGDMSRARGEYFGGCRCLAPRDRIIYPFARIRF